MSIIWSSSPQNTTTTTTTTVWKYQQFFFFFLNAHSKRLGWVFLQQIVGSQSNVRDDREKGLLKKWRYSNTKGCGWMLTWGNSSRAGLRARGHRQGAGHSLWKRKCDPSLHSGGDWRSAFVQRCCQVDEKSPCVPASNGRHFSVQLPGRFPYERCQHGEHSDSTSSPH